MECVNFKEFVEKKVKEIGLLSKSYTKDNIPDFIKKIKDDFYGLSIGAKWDEEKAKIRITYLVEDLNCIYKGQTPGCYPLPK